MRFPALYIAAIVISANAGLLVASNTHGLTWASAVFVLKIVLWMAACAYVATLTDRISSSSDADEVAVGTALMLACSAPLARVVWVTQRGEMATWSLAFVGVTALVLLGMFLRDDASGLDWIAGTWATATSLLQAGQFDIFPYARGAMQSVRALHTVLDLRIATTALFAIILFTRGLVAAVERGQPKIDDLPLLRIPPPESDWPPLLTAVSLPFLYIGDTLFRVMQAVANVLWKLVATIAVFFYRISEEIAEEVVALFSNVALIRAVLKSVGAILLSFVTLLLVFRAARSLPAYIRNEELLGQIVPLVKVLFFLLLASAVATCICWVFGRHKAEDLWLTAPFVVSNFIAIAFIAGITLFVLAHIESMALNGFRRLGLFSWTLILLMVVGIPVWVTTRSAKKARPRRARRAA